MSFYQVNQRMSFQREFNNGYLCCPNGSRGGWPLMKELKTGDILFHYNSTRGAVLGVSRVSNIGQHKGGASETANVIPGTRCILYSGRHLSYDDLTLEQKEGHKKYSGFLEVHTVPVLKRNLGKLLLKTPQVYLLPIGDGAARRFIEERGIRLDDLQ